MRSPDVHRLFQTPRSPGLTEVLGRECSLEEAVVTNWTENLDILPAGVLHKTPHELLGNAAFDPVLDQLRGAYGFIVIDTPPILPASESLVLAKAADAALLCAMRGRSRESQTRLAYERLAGAGARPIGAVLNAVPARRYATTYGKYAYAYQPS
jgi:polysaccharide biosynthesis transport protein